MTGMVHGTPAFLAPEVARGADASPASDVFSLGATLYAALEGIRPSGPTPAPSPSCTGPPRAHRPAAAAAAPWPRCCWRCWRPTRTTRPRWRAWRNGWSSCGRCGGVGARATPTDAALTLRSLAAGAGGRTAPPSEPGRRRCRSSSRGATPDGHRRPLALAAALAASSSRSGCCCARGGDTDRAVVAQSASASCRASPRGHDSAESRRPSRIGVRVERRAGRRPAPLRGGIRESPEPPRGRGSRARSRLKPRPSPPRRPPASRARASSPPRSGTTTR